MKITIKLPSDAELDLKLQAVPSLERYAVGDKVVRAGTAVIRKRAEHLMPRSRAADTMLKTDARKEEASWDETRLGKTVRHTVRKNDRGGAIGVVGPQFTGKSGPGQKIFLVADHKQRGRREWFWGHDGGRTKLKIRNVMVRAAAEVRPETLAAMKKQLKLAMDRLFHG